ncbi:MAG TPA: DNA alkylation repair protein [Actinomycetes bacterium]
MLTVPYGDAVAADRELVEQVRRGLAEAADPARAPAMQAYMKSTMPFHGVAAPQARRVFRAAFDAHPLADRRAWQDTVTSLWDEAGHREERYAAIALARHPRYRAHRDARLLPLWAHLVTTGAWWDLVDDVAAHLVGPLLLTEHAAAEPVVRGWATDSDRWLRRAAVICQLAAKERTDLDLLTVAVDANLDDPDFFLRKAIGWALRQYAYADPDWVRRFVAARSDRLSGLSRREALKHLGAA